jgi:phage major head subunit gpT-like protein
LKKGKVKNTATLGLMRAQKEIAANVIAATYEAAEDLLDAAKEAVPIVTGELHDSGTVRELDNGGQPVFTAEYAVDVHENAESAGFGFLQNAADNEAAVILEKVASKAKVR